MAEITLLYEDGRWLVAYPGSSGCVNVWFDDVEKAIKEAARAARDLALSEGDRG